MNFLISGVAGFLGAALANHLVQQGHHVRGIDDLSTGDPQALLPDVHFTRGDVRDRPKLWTLLQDIDCVVHLAARVSVSESILYPSDYNDVNVGGTVSLMEAMRDVGIRRVILASSGAVYGPQEEQPIKEGSIVRPDSPYAVSKLAAEYYVNTIGMLWGIETVCLRIFNAYGPGQHLPPSHPPVIPYFLRQAVRKGTIVIHGNGSQTRDFVYVDDVIAALVAAANAPRVNRHIINIGSGKGTSISELVRLIQNITQKEINVIENPQTSPGVDRMQADITLAKEKLGYEPRVSLIEGLRLTLEKDARFSNG